MLLDFSMLRLCLELPVRNALPHFMLNRIAWLAAGENTAPTYVSIRRGKRDRLSFAPYASNQVTGGYPTRDGREVVNSFAVNPARPYGEIPRYSSATSTRTGRVARALTERPCCGQNGLSYAQGVKRLTRVFWQSTIRIKIVRIMPYQTSYGSVTTAII